MLNHIREMQMKTTMRYHLQPVRMGKINKTGKIGADEDVDKGLGTLMHCWWECKLVQPVWKTEWRFLNKLTSYDPEIELLGIYTKDAKVPIQIGTCQCL